jgi:hypothetical protein
LRKTRGWSSQLSSLMRRPNSWWMQCHLVRTSHPNVNSEDAQRARGCNTSAFQAIGGLSPLPPRSWPGVQTTRPFLPSRWVRITHCGSPGSTASSRSVSTGVRGSLWEASPCLVRLPYGQAHPLLMCLRRAHTANCCTGSSATALVPNGLPRVRFEESRWRHISFSQDHTAIGSQWEASSRLLLPRHCLAA